MLITSSTDMWASNPCQVAARIYRMCLKNQNTNRMIEGSLEVKLPTIWTDEKQRRRRRREKRRAEERRSEKRKSQKKEDAGARKGRKASKLCVFPMICGSVVEK
jgi:chromosomal replication initiation ATPase DnaA